MRARRWTMAGVVLAATTFAAGCATAGGQDGSTTMAKDDSTTTTAAMAAKDPGRGWIVTDDAAAAAILRTCSRASPDREAVAPRWVPTAADIAALEAALPTIAAGSDPARYHRQYVGFERDGAKLIYLNAWPTSVPSPANLAREAVRVCDGGKQFWGAVWDPGTRTFSDLAGNGGF